MRFVQLIASLILVGTVVACGSTTRQPAASVAKTTPAATASALSGLPASRTPEGYHVLGDPNAPQTIEFFSDFL